MPAEHATQALALVSPSFGLNLPCEHALLEAGVVQKLPAEHGEPSDVLPSGQNVPATVHGAIVSAVSQ